ncbi:MFS general substrate transporter [Thozetella sp. PMI_491]|nr:MFS general substrate transporter [Thozetella sp. PMI_491]
MESKQSGRPVFEPSRRFYWAFFALCVLALSASFSSTSLSIAVTTIAQEFDLAEPEAFWLGSSAALASTVLQPCSAALSDVLGRKGALTLTATSLGAGSLIAAVAPSYAVLILGRSLQGIGSGGISAITDIIITDIVPLRFRGQWFAYISVPWAIGTAVGPILSGVLTNHGLWRWICAINVITCAAAIPLCVWALPPLPRKQDWMARLRSVDYMGFFILCGSLIAILVPIMQATVVYPWRDVRTLLPLMLGIAGLFVFLFFEWRIAKCPLVPLNRFQNRTCILVFLCTALHGLILWCLMYYLPVYYEAVKDFTALKSGLAVLPETLTIVPASMAIGTLVGWTGRYRWAIWSGWALSTAGLGLLYLLDESTSTVGWIFINMPAGFGIGILFGAMGFAIQAAVDAESVPVAVTLYSFWRAFGATLGISIGSSIFASEIPQAPSLAGRAEPGATASTIYARSALGFLSMNKGARVYALRKIWIFCTAICGLAMLASFGIQSFSLDQPLLKLKEEEINESEETIV